MKCVSNGSKLAIFFIPKSQKLPAAGEYAPRSRCVIRFSCISSFSSFLCLRQFSNRLYYFLVQTSPSPFRHACNDDAKHLLKSSSCTTWCALIWLCFLCNRSSFVKILWNLNIFFFNMEPTSFVFTAYDEYSL